MKPKYFDSIPNTTDDFTDTAKIHKLIFQDNWL